jgi:hypothetical protein
MKKFLATIHIIGINPYVYLPAEVLASLFEQAERQKGPIPVRGRINGKPFIQTLVKFQGAWRLYINGEMRRAAGIDAGDQAEIRIEFDPVPRIEPVPPNFAAALSNNKKAAKAFTDLPASRQKEILRYLNSMKTDASLERNIRKIIQRLQGNKPGGLHHIFEARDRR